LAELANTTFDELDVDTAVNFTHSFSPEDIEAYILLCGDHSPIHASMEAALARGHQDRVVHGLLASSLYSTLIGVYLPGLHGLLLGCQIDFHQPIYPNEILNVTGTVKTKHIAYRIVDIKAEIRGADGRRRSKAILKVQLHA
jgi:3-hydroxybutyryl-CoA dehydratase